MAAEATSRTVKGGCHCGKIRYEARVRVDPDGRVSASRCNCTFCQKLGTTNCHLTSCRCAMCKTLPPIAGSSTSSSAAAVTTPEPSSSFTLTSPRPPFSPSELGAYAPRTPTLARYFCRGCGSHVWGEGFYHDEPEPEPGSGEPGEDGEDGEDGGDGSQRRGQRHDLLWINVATVDQPQPGVIDLSTLRVRYYDMLNGNAAGGARDEPWPCGLP
ncbi:hypothetical protein GGR56DRAFT_610064 [Xylariaceae sp. FL0804]|nr:hypothetical protein GGR56DRAFT_610064 [Xylariaceae sp. FL0804]